MKYGTLLLLLLAPLTHAPLTHAQHNSPQSTATTLPSATQTASSDEVAKREILLAPVLQFVKQHDYVAALPAIQPALTAYPRDFRVLLLAADINRINRNFEQALSLYQRCLNLKTPYGGAVHLGRVRVYADTSHWEDFNRERTVVRQLALQGDPTLPAADGYIIEDHRDGKLHIEAIEFPATDPAAVTRFRFLFIPNYDAATRFTPSIDLESNPVDIASFARQYPHQAAAHLRPFALVSYPDAHTRSFEKFYASGEPPYEDLHTDVLMRAPGFPHVEPPPAQHTPHRAPYKRPSTPQEK